MVEYEAACFTEVKSDFRQHASQRLKGPVGLWATCFTSTYVTPICFVLFMIMDLPYVRCGMDGMSEMMYQGICLDLAKVVPNRSPDLNI